MFISHRCQFIVFSDPFQTSDWLHRTLVPWCDQIVAPTRKKTSKSMFFNGMSPAEAELAFDLLDLPFHKYTCISVVQNPFRRMAQLYDRIVATDPIWKLRQKAGWAIPDFAEWLERTKPDGIGAGHRFAPRWQKFGAYSADAWSGGRITHHLRAENAGQDLRDVFLKMGLVPAFSRDPNSDVPDRMPEMLRYDATTMDIVRQRYSSDLKAYGKQEPRLRLVA